MKTFRYILILQEDAPGHNSLKKGFKIIGNKAYFSEASCAEDARLIAQSMFVKDGAKYGFECVSVEYEPPNLTQSQTP